MEKRTIGLSLAVIMVLGLVGFAEAQAKVPSKTIRKVITPQIAPATPPPAEAPVARPAVPPPPVEVKRADEWRGLFGWGINTALSGKVLSGSILGAVRGDIIFSDPLKMGGAIGLAEDAVEYRLGLGYAASDKLKSVPIFADVVVHLREGSLFGLDPYIGAGAIYNAYGTGKVSGGLGGQAYLGLLADLGLGSKTGFSLGYASYQVGETLMDNGPFIAVTQPIKF